MSNFKTIDGITINLDLITAIEVLECEEKEVNTPYTYFQIEFISSLIDNRLHDTRCDTEYRTEKEARDRIKEIIKNQNNNKIEI